MRYIDEKRKNRHQTYNEWLVGSNNTCFIILNKILNSNLLYGKTLV